MQISVAGTDIGFESNASPQKSRPAAAGAKRRAHCTESRSSSHGGRLITIYRPESRRLILQLLQLLQLLTPLHVRLFKSQSSAVNNL
jgi:hypothetical protein